MKLECRIDKNTWKEELNIVKSIINDFIKEHPEVEDRIKFKCRESQGYMTLSTYHYGDIDDDDTGFSEYFADIDICKLNVRWNEYKFVKLSIQWDEHYIGKNGNGVAYDLCDALDNFDYNFSDEIDVDVKDLHDAVLKQLNNLYNFYLTEFKPTYKLLYDYNQKDKQERERIKNFILFKVNSQLA